jgi:hypothetical protein
MSEDARVRGVVISRSGERVWAYVTTPWSVEVLAVLEEHGIEALALGADSEIRGDDDLAGLDRLTSLRALEIDWSRTPMIPEATLWQLDELALTGRSGATVPVASLPRLRSLEYRPGRVAGALADVPRLEHVTTRGMPRDGFGAFDACAALRLVRMNGRGVTTLGCASPPRALESLILSGIALATLEGVEGLPVINDLAVEGGREAAGLALDLTPLRSCPSLRVFSARGYAAYEGEDAVLGTLERLALAAR